jgi:hypothetical protein
VHEQGRRDARRWCSMGHERSSRHACLLAGHEIFEFSPL